MSSEAPVDETSASSPYAEEHYQRLLKIERPSSEALGLLAELDVVVNAEEGIEIVDVACNNLKTQLTNFFRNAKKAIAQHESDAIEAERRYRLRQLAAKEEEIESLRRRVAAVETSQDHVDAVIDNCADTIARCRAALRDRALLNQAWRAWADFVRHNKALKSKMMKFMQRYDGPELARRALRGWKDETERAKAESMQTRHAKSQKDLEDRLTSAFAQERAALTDRINTLEGLLESERLLRIKLEEDMRQAFMRGVTALNLEAISMLKRGVPHIEHNLPGPYTPATSTTTTTTTAAAPAPAAAGLGAPGFARGGLSAAEIQRMTAADISALVSSALGGAAAPQPRAAVPTPYAK